MKKCEFLDPVTVGLVIALVVGLGIAIHPSFFLIALSMAMIAFVQRVFHLIGEHTHRTNLTRRHR
jgi:hypothetical protein